MDLLLHNSLTNKLEKFDHDKNNPIKWYTCGPTIYDDAHLGHAKTFITFDIIRRVLQYLGYNVLYVMNITDIDDKIINNVKNLKIINNEKNLKIGDDNEKNLKIEDDNFDIKNYMDFISKMEKDFWEDMDKLDIMRPTVVTRVTEYIEEMKEYIEGMEKNNMTYSINGSVYLDSEKFKENNFKWDIFNRGSDSSYTECEYSVDKKNNCDFSLWKASKPGEIKFNSKWGYGRPGWSLECSVMSHKILGSHLDIHSGGIDLIYPHHNNEIIQSIAFNNNPDIPIKFFLHSGHLNIDGNKMSKSLKNFISIKKYLENGGTSRQLRLLFLLHHWDKPLDFSESTINETIVTEKRIKDFYSNINYVLKNSEKINTSFNDIDEEYNAYILKISILTREFLHKNIDTKNIMKLFLEGIGVTYKYLENKFNVNLVKIFYENMDTIFKVFGVDFNDSILGYKDIDDTKDKIINMLVNFRGKIRQLVKNKDVPLPKEFSSKFFSILDDLRDNELKKFGIIIEDSNNDIFKWKYE